MCQFLNDIGVCHCCYNNLTSSKINSFLPRITLNAENDNKKIFEWVCPPLLWLHPVIGKTFFLTLNSEKQSLHLLFDLLNSLELDREKKHLTVSMKQTLSPTFCMSLKASGRFQLCHNFCKACSNTKFVKGIVILKVLLMFIISKSNRKVAAD